MYTTAFDIMLEQFMKIAIEEARLSFREGNHGFGAVIVKEGIIISQSHDRDKTLHDPTFHADLDAIRIASKKLNGNLGGCTIISTHEPCPMCASAIVWAGITEVVFGYSIDDSIKEGRRRINIKCEEIFEKAGVQINITKAVLKDECSVLYDNEVRESIKLLRNADSERLELFSKELSRKRKNWFIRNRSELIDDDKNTLENAYEIFLKKLGICESEAKAVERTEDRIVIHSKNFCPTLEACKILDLDTRYICKKLNEAAMDALMKEISPDLEFKRNYNTLRPFSGYCEEEIRIMGRN